MSLYSILRFGVVFLGCLYLLMMWRQRRLARRGRSRPVKVPRELRRFVLQSGARIHRVPPGGIVTTYDSIRFERTANGWRKLAK